jgi:Acetyltransferase (GNAT) domain
MTRAPRGALVLYAERNENFIAQAQPVGFAHRIGRPHRAARRRRVERGHARAAGRRLVCSGIFYGDMLLGFICTLDDGAQALAYHIGFDRAAAKDHPLYLRLLHASIDDAIAIGARELSLGRTALEPKSRLGAKPQPTAIWVRHRQPMMNRLVQPLLGLAHPDEAPEVQPFKQNA